jgi:hypothetical protein
MTYVVENWENTRHGVGEILDEVLTLRTVMEPVDLDRLTDDKSKCYHDWLNAKNYSPDRAEKFRRAAKEKMLGVKQ